MPYRTVMEKFTDGRMSWMEPTQVWVEPTPEEAAEEAAARARDEAFRADLTARTEKLIADMKAVGL